MRDATRLRAPGMAALCLTLLAAGRVVAQPTLTVAANGVQYKFAESISFSLDATSDAPIRHVVLRYQTDPGGPIDRRIPAFSPGRNIQAVSTETLERGEIPPSATITWWWTLETDDGGSYSTPRQSTTYVDRRFEWRYTDGADVRVWTYDPDASKTAAIADDAATALDRLAAVLGNRPKRRVNIVAYESPADMQPALVPHGEVYESQLTTLGARVAPDIVVLLVNAGQTAQRDVLAHELSHVVLAMHFAEPYVEAPLWLDEGLAMYNEGPLDRGEQGQLDTAVRQDSLMSVRSLTSFPGEADLVPLAYAESRDVVSFLIDSGGTNRFDTFLDRLGGGDEGADAALQAVYGYDQLSLYQAYRAARGLEPAATPRPGEPRLVRRAQSGTAGGLCGSVALLLPALAVAWRHKRARADRMPPGGRADRRP